MSTRANVVIKDQYGELWFYRHSDGYPEGTMPTLEKFLKWVKEGKIRDNINQAAGWLTLIGAEEYGVKRSWADGELVETPKETVTEPSSDSMSGWKCGAYEPTVRQHGDIEYLYTIDLDKKTLTYTSL